jgi:hypothetical protein
MKKLIMLALLLTAACSNSTDNNGMDAGSGSDAGSDQAEFTCFSGTASAQDTPAQVHDEIVNKCADQTVTAIVKYKTLKDRTTALPLLNSNGTRPPLP